VSIANQ